MSHYPFLKEVFFFPFAFFILLGYRKNPLSLPCVGVNAGFQQCTQCSDLLSALDPRKPCMSCLRKVYLFFFPKILRRNPKVNMKAEPSANVEVAGYQSLHLHKSNSWFSTYKSSLLLCIRKNHRTKGNKERAMIKREREFWTIVSTIRFFLSPGWSFHLDDC